MLPKKRNIDVPPLPPPTQGVSINNINEDLGYALSIVNTKDDRLAYLKKYMKTLGMHKITDMKHDDLGVTSSNNNFLHFKEFVPKICKQAFNEIIGDDVERSNYSSINDSSFLQSHVRLLINDDPYIPTGLTDLMNKIVEYESNQIQLEIWHDTSKIGEEINPIYTFSTVAKNKYDEVPDAEQFLNDLEIASESIFNVDFQYKLWTILKKGEPSGRVIYLKKTSENENDPAGKYNIIEPIFRQPTGATIQFAINLEPNSSIYKSFDDRFAIWNASNSNTTLNSIIDTVTPDFFSRFEVTTGPLLPIKTCFGFFERFSSPITISDRYVGFTYTSDSKQDNSNKNVRKKIDKLYNDKKPGYEIALACEAAKKGSGDDLQLLSQRNTKSQFFKIIDPTSINVANGKDAYTLMKNTDPSIQLTGKEYFVSHDGPTCIRNLIEGNNLLLMHISGWAVKFERGPPVIVSVDTKIMNIISMMNKPTFESTLTGEILANPTSNIIVNSPGNPYIERCIQISMFYNKIVDRFYESLNLLISNSYNNYITEHTNTKTNTNNLLKICRKYLFYLLCYCNLKQYTIKIPIRIYPDEFTQAEIEFVQNGNIANNLKEEPEEYKLKLLHKLESLCKLQQIQLEGYKNLSKYVNASNITVLDEQKLLKLVSLTSEGQTLSNWNINIDRTSRRIVNVDPLKYPLNLLFIDKLSEYLSDDLKRSAITLFDTYPLENKFGPGSYQTINSAYFHANIWSTEC
jgi:hypothetical protein